jgi:hypothetical protein
MKHEFTSHQIFTAIAGALAEWFFSMLPLLVVTIVMTHLGRSSMVLESAEWTFGASILAGQALVRLVVGVVRAKRLAIERVILGISTILVFVVVPSNIILALVIMTEANDQHISSLLAAAQAGLFFLSSVLFILIASFAHLWTRRADQPVIRNSEI